MNDHNRPTFLYKLEAACAGVLGSDSNSSASSFLKEHFDYIRRLHEHGDIILFGVTLNPDRRRSASACFEQTPKTRRILS